MLKSIVKKFPIVLSLVLIVATACFGSVYAMDETEREKLVEDARAVAESSLFPEEIMNIQPEGSNITREDCENLSTGAHELFVGLQWQLPKSVQAAIKEPSGVLFEILANNKPAGVVSVTLRDGVLRRSVLSGDGNETRINKNKFVQRTKNDYIVISSGLERFLYGTLEGKEVLMSMRDYPFENPNIQSYKDSIGEDLLLIAKEDFQSMLNQSKANADAGKIGGGFTLRYLPPKSSQSAQDNSVWITITLVAAGITLFVALPAILIIRKKSRLTHR